MCKFFGLIMDLFSAMAAKILKMLSLERIVHKIFEEQDFTNL